jgi:hypothetical protein
MKRFSVAVVFLLLLAGCSGSDDESSESSDSTTATAQCESQSGASLSKKRSPVLHDRPRMQDRPTMYLTDVEVEVEGEDCVERVIFKFEPNEPGPGYDVSFQPAEVAKIQDGSGKALEIAGEDFLVVRMFPAWTAKIEGEDVEPTYDGPRSIPAPADATMLREVAMTGDFEAQVTWAIGLESKRPFTVTASDNELVVEISNVAATS